MWTDGTPRVVPIGFTWTGKELVTSSPSSAPKLLALKEGDKVTVTFDSYTPPFMVLYIRGIVHICPCDELVPDWCEAAVRMMGKAGAEGFINMSEAMLKAGAMKITRLAVEPTLAGIVEFQTRFPSGIEKGMEAMAAMAGNA
ncbi:MAG TPA: hypothetical protein VF831_11795 [Anaerolineales bacterium]